MQKFRVKYTEWNPWSIVRQVGNETVQDGIAHELYECMRTTMNFQYTATLQEDLQFGAILPDGKWNGMVASMLRNESDVSGPYFITEERASVLEYGNPIATAQLCIASGLVPANKSPFLIFRIFSLQVWFFTVAASLFTTAAAAVIYSILPASDKRKPFEVLLRYLWMFYGSLVGKGYGSEHQWFLRHVCQSISFRCLQFFWLTGPALILMYTYQGAIISAFTTDKLKPKVSTMEELIEDTSVKPSAVENTYVSICLENLKGTKYDSVGKHIHKNLVEPYRGYDVPWLYDIEKGDMAFISDIMSLKLLVGEHFKRTGTSRIKLMPIDLCKAYIAPGFRKGFPRKVLKEFKKRSRWFYEGHLYQRWISKSTHLYDTYIQDVKSEARPLDLSDLTGAFLLYWIGISASVVVFIIERHEYSCKIKRGV